MSSQQTEDQHCKSRVEMSSQQKEDQHACRVTRKKVHVRPNVTDVATRCVFSMIRGSSCSNSSLAKAAGAEVAV